MQLKIILRSVCIQIEQFVKGMTKESLAHIIECITFRKTGGFKQLHTENDRQIAYQVWTTIRKQLKDIQSEVIDEMAILLLKQF